MLSLSPAFLFLPHCCLAVRLHYFTLHLPANLLFPCKLSRIPKQPFCQHHRPFTLMTTAWAMVTAIACRGFSCPPPSLLVPARNWVLRDFSLSSSQHSSSRAAVWCTCAHRLYTLFWMQVRWSQTARSTRSWRKISSPAWHGAFLFLLQYDWLSWQSSWALLATSELSSSYPQVQCREFSLPSLLLA